MTLLVLLLVVGVFNAAAAYLEDILMIKQYPREPEAWLEAILYTLLWPVQLAFWIGMKIWQAMDWCQAKIWGA